MNSLHLLVCCQAFSLYVDRMFVSSAFTVSCLIRHTLCVIVIHKNTFAIILYINHILVLKF